VTPGARWRSTRRQPLFVERLSASQRKRLGVPAGG
jgi:hypothetical protein